MFPFSFTSSKARFVTWRALEMIGRWNVLGADYGDVTRRQSDRNGWGAILAHVEAVARERSVA
jgi:hypothetical protein